MSGFTAAPSHRFDFEKKRKNQNYKMKKDFRVRCRGEETKSGLVSYIFENSPDNKFLLVVAIVPRFQKGKKKRLFV
jgi:hypothetical protein